MTGGQDPTSPARIDQSGPDRPGLPHPSPDSVPDSVTSIRYSEKGPCRALHGRPGLADPSWHDPSWHHLYYRPGYTTLGTPLPCTMRVLPDDERARGGPVGLKWSWGSNLNLTLAPGLMD